ncbi:hypothetical protein RB628_07040 [Streptomyces sp. ADMS]|nr:hypothetical protein [Streptomyces sp. ADMS]MDW4905109.1 hypothetical protein [Streptomyces sp. ADMS]
MKPLDRAPVGTMARDTRTDRVGKVMGYEGPYAQLRPLEGGREWDVHPNHIEPLSLSSALSGPVADLNERSHGGL